MEIRTTPPNSKNKFYIHNTRDGYNKCIRISGDSCLPNCVGYAYGRYMEIADIKSCNLPTVHAEDWFALAKKRGFKVGKTPKPGAVICWSKGKTGYSGDGCGHVAIVEQVNKDGSILISQSGYGSGRRMWTATLKKPYPLAGYKLQGFIYQPGAAKAKTPTYKTGKTYKVVCDAGLNVRNKPSTSGKKLKAIPKGTSVKCLQISGDWMRIGNGQWVCCKAGGETYVR